MENRLEVLRIEMDKLIMASDRPRVYFSHLQCVSHFCTLLALKRNLNVELATTCGILHDIANVNGSGGDNHTIKGAEEAEELLRAMNSYNDDEIKIISIAISRHNDKNTVHEPFDELLKDADVMSHCFYNHDFPIAEWEMGRYKNLLTEFNITSPNTIE